MSDTKKLLSSPGGQFVVKLKSKKSEASIEYSGNDNVKVFVSKCAREFGINENRIRLTYKKDEKDVVLDEKKEIGSYNIPEGSVITLKDLGQQIGYRTVFIFEYLGPFLIFPLVFLFTKFIHEFYYPPSSLIEYGPFSGVQLLGLVLWTIHYGKRLFETIFIHSFSHGTMPLGNLFKNCSYYWGFTFLIAYIVSHPLYTEPHIILVVIGTIIFSVSECLNFSTHYYFSTLRTKPGNNATGTDHPVPTKWMFHYAICPNYSFEILAWLGYNLATFTLIGFLFNLAGAAQMYVWAKGKKKRYVKELEGKTDPENPNFPQKVKLLFPFLV